MRDFLLLNKKE